MTMKIKYAFLLIAICVVLSSCTSSKEGDVAKFKNMVDAGLLELNGNYVLEGDVQDEEGTLLNDISIYMIKSKATGFMASENTDSFVKSDGHFSIRENGYSSLLLTFSKPGYYPETLDLCSKEQRGHLFKDNELKVVLKKKGIPAKMLHHDYTIELTYNFTGKVIRLNAQESDTIKRPGSSDDKNLYISGSKIDDIEKNSIPCIYATADKNEKKQLLVKLIDGGYEPVNVKLVVNTPDSGFIVYKPINLGLAYREMLKAPMDGYQKEMILDANALRKGGIFFYVKAGNVLGKGKIISLDYVDEKNSSFRAAWKNADKHDQGTVKVSIELFINQEGTRNLESGD